MKAHSNRIYGTGVWNTVGENPIRFTAKDHKPYAVLLEWTKDDSMVIKSLNSCRTNSSGPIRLLSGQNVDYELVPDGLKINLPKERLGNHAYVLGISGSQYVLDLPFVIHKIIIEYLYLKHKTRVMGLNEVLKKPLVQTIKQSRGSK